MREARPDAIAVLTPHGITVEGKMSLGVTPRAQGELDGLSIDVPTDLDLAAAWAYRAAETASPSRRSPGATRASPCRWTGA